MKMIAILAGLFLAACARTEYQQPVVGPTGPAGAIGATGPQGSTGSTGAAGQNGTNGTNGTNGVNGVNGTNGQNGTNGTNGVNGTNGNGFEPGIACDGYAITTASYSGTVSWDTLFSTATLLFNNAVLPAFNDAQTLDNATFNGITPQQAALLGQTNWALDCYANLNIPETGLYNFALSSDDGSQLAIDGQVLINMPYSQDYPTAYANNVQLFAGPHKLNLLYFQSLPTQIGLTLQWQGPSNQSMGTYQVIPASAYTH